MALTRPRAAQIYNLDYKQAARAVTITNVTLAGGAPAVVDGVSLSLNDRVLVTGQNTGSQNGIYYVSTVGSGSNGTWILASDDNTTGEVDAGMIVMVTEGAIYADTQWKLITDNPIIIGTTALTFTQNYLANAIIAGTSNVSVTSNANVNISSAGTANVLTISSTGTVVKGTESVTGNITSGNILTGGLISATGNIITAGNFVGNGAALTGITASAGAAITNGTSNVTVASSANTTVGVAGTTVSTFASTGLYLPGIVSAIGNITGNVFIGNGSQLTGLPAGYTNANLATLGSNVISTTGTVTAGNITGGNILTGGLISATGNITGGNITIPGSANISTFIGNVFFGSVPAQPTYYNIAPLNINNSLAAATKVQLNLINTGGGAGAGSGIDFYTYQISVAAANAEARIAGIDDGNYSAYLSLQTKTPGSTGTNTLVERVKIDSTGASVVANVTGGNLLTGGLISATSTITSAANITGGNLLTAGLMSSTGNGIHGNILTAGLISATSNITGGNLSVSTGTITVGNIVCGAGNLVGSIGNATTWFGNAYVKAVNAFYADLAEMYCADTTYPPGTVVEFGGTSEITVTTTTHSTAVAGIISTNPSYLMNSTIACEVNALEVALVGRVPCRVVGTIRKGDRLVSSSMPGVATVLEMDKYEPGCIVGKALEDYDSIVDGVIEVAVGRI